LITILLGSTPYVIYLFVLLKNNALEFFISQMTGRSELLQTGIIAYGKSFISSYLLPVNCLLIVYLVYLLIIKKSMTSKVKNYFIAFFGVTTSVYCISIFFTDLNNLLWYPFEIFWSLIAIYILIEKKSRDKNILIISVLIISWISSISLGDNSPVFMTGVLVSLIFIVVYERLKIYRLGYLFPVLSLIVFGVSVYGQRNINYRDLSSEELKYNLGDVFSGFGSIRTNTNTYEYFKELNEILSSIDNIKDHFVMIPNNAVVYPLVKSRNPFPVDWMQKDEYIGSEIYLNEKIENKLSSQTIYFIIDKFNSKLIAFNIADLDYSNKNYNYYSELFEFELKLVMEKKYFKIYKVN
ncbi:MAG: hypothetical protein ABIJ97_17570, partial [Bacteroidota bacterium]